MTKDVLVSVEGLQFSTGEMPGKVEIINAGNYYKKDDYHYVLYDETMEGFDQVTKNMIKFREGSAYLKKKGAVNVDMHFEENQKNSSCYTTPFGDIMLDISTTNVAISEDEQQIVLDVDYALEANYEHLADCRIKIRVCPREKGAQMIERELS
ncbi:MAG: DUF1934 domain-containing protein [Lachnospiraceae bacterium]|nr:DUF1934 domain-containing protein [Lachnospiraceae bacterium]